MGLDRYGTLVAVAACSVALGLTDQPLRGEGVPATAAATIAISPVEFPAYDAYRGIERCAPTPDSYKEAIADSRFVMERVTYRSDDLEVFAYLYRPAVPPEGERLPVVVFNRGSYVRDGFAPEVLMLGNRLAQQGYLIVAPMLRGSGGAAGHDELGGADLHDLFNIVPVIEEIAYADPDRIFLYGESRGGVMCLLAAKNGFPARAMATYGAFTDLGDLIREGSPMRPIGPVVWPGFPANEAEIVEARSALRWAERIGIPLLIMHGGEDGDVSPLHSLRLAEQLQEHGRAYELKIFHGEQHVLSGRAAERDADAARWFRRFDVGR